MGEVTYPAAALDALKRASEGGIRLVSTRSAVGRLRGFRAEYGPLSIAPRSDSSEIQRFLGAIVLLPSRIDGVGVFAVRDLSAEAVLYDSDCMSDSQALLPRAMMNDACMPDFAAIHSPGSAMSVMDAYTLRSEAACNILVEHQANSTGERFALAIGPGGTGAALPLRTRVTVTRAIPKGGELLRSYSAEHWLETMTAFSAVLPEYRAQVEMVQHTFLLRALSGLTGDAKRQARQAVFVRRCGM